MKLATWEELKSQVNKALLQYLQPIDNLSDPKGPLFSAVNIFVTVQQLFPKQSSVCTTAMLL